MDTARVRALYISTGPEDHPQANFAQQIEAKKRTGSIYAARSAGVMDYRKITYECSRRDGDPGVSLSAAREAAPADTLRWSGCTTE